MASSVIKEISYEDLKALVGKSQNLVLVDVRSKEELEKGRIPGSVHIPIDTVEAALSMEPEAFKAKYGVTKPTVDAPELVFHCHMGKRGGMATSKAYELGYVNARNYAGAYKEWSEKEGK
ncbi:thiosulfate:glutathione sulfurtransferase [Chaetodon trifascialis]|uniref:thiosulfate:glutathione sulfurtransferase n=1 Tax=Chaetodon trifascialis TaxID=109706 RepID=UPI003996C68A